MNRLTWRRAHWWLAVGDQPLEFGISSRNNSANSEGWVFFLPPLGVGPVKGSLGVHRCGVDIQHTAVLEGFVPFLLWEGQRQFRAREANSHMAITSQMPDDH